MPLDSLGWMAGGLAVGTAAMWWHLRRRCAALESSESHLRDFAEANADWFWERDASYRFIAFTPGFAAAGFRPEEFLGKTRLDACPEGTDEVVWARHKAEIAERRPFRDLVVSRRNDRGARVWFSISGRPVFDRHGEFTGYRGTARIVTDTIQRESELAEKSHELELAQERLLDFAAATSDWLWEQDPELRFTYFSKPFVPRAPDGTTGDIGRRLSELPGCTASEADLAAQQALMVQHKPFRDFRLRQIGEDRLARTISFSGRPIFDTDGRFRGYRGTASDVTSEVAAAERARAAERQLYQALDGLGASLAIFDADDVLTFRNRAFSATASQAADLGPGRTFIQIIDGMIERGLIDTEGVPVADWRRWRMARHLAPADSIDVRFTNGRIIQILEQRTPEGGIALIGTDVTQLRQRQRQIEHQSQILTRVFESIDEGILVYDKDACLAMWNEQAVGIIGIEPTMLRVGAPFIESIAHQLERGDFGPCDDIPTEAARRLLLNRTRGSTSEGWRPNGRYIRAQRTLLRDGGWVTLFVDLTERRRFEDALRDAKEAAEAANRSKSDFLAHMSHELRTPLNAVIGFSEIIFREMFGPVGEPRYVDYARDIHASGTHLLNVIGDILDIAKAESGNAELDEQAVDLGEIAAASVRLIDPRAHAGQIRVEMRVTPDLPKIDADARRLKQVLINLLANAVKFTPPGGRVTVEVGLGPDGGARLVVRDTGIGMRAEDIPRALEPFSQVDNALSRRFEGTGLGLPLSKKLVELHGGKLAIESTIDRGTTVIVTLPATRTLRV